MVQKPTKPLAADGRRLGGAIIVIDADERRGELAFLYVKVGVQSKGIGQAIWKAIETMHPEAAGLRHLSFEVDNIIETKQELDALGISHEQVRTDEYTGKRFFFFQDPDGLPIEVYEK